MASGASATYRDGQTTFRKPLPFAQGLDLPTRNLTPRNGRVLPTSAVPGQYRDARGINLSNLVAAVRAGNAEGSAEMEHIDVLVDFLKTFGPHGPRSQMISLPHATPQRPVLRSRLLRNPCTATALFLVACRC